MAHKKTDNPQSLYKIKENKRKENEMQKWECERMVNMMGYTV